MRWSSATSDGSPPTRGWTCCWPPSPRTPGSGFAWPGQAPQRDELGAAVERLGPGGPRRSSSARWVRTRCPGSTGHWTFSPSRPADPGAGLEQFGRVAVEAMACGVPVVASDSGALSDVVGGAGLLVPPGDADRLREALLRVGLDPALAHRLRTAGLAFAATCDWPVVAQRYLEHATMLHEPTPPARAGRRARDRGGPGGLRLAGVGAHGPFEPVRSLPVTVVDNSSLPAIRGAVRRVGGVAISTPAATAASRSASTPPSGAAAGA
ncbi:MAG: glycosyltransferase family 4 protein [Propionibacteriaceae bacterium]|nr:glycosyltransferase family 4 protein [Propionibacteriaceae bacterium]